MLAKRVLNPHSLPNRLPQGIPNRTREQYYPDGSLARQRVFDEDGNKVVDHDHHEGEDEAGYDHDHTWNGNNRGEASPANKFAAVGTLIVTGAGLIWLVVNDVTGVGVADDAILPVVATTFIAAWIVLFDKGDNEKW